MRATAIRRFNNRHLPHSKEFSGSVFEYRKTGIILSGLVPNENLTKRLFDDEKFEREHKLMKAIDELNQKFGKDTVRFGSVKSEGRWKMKQTRKSQSYTTNWNELLLVR